MPTITRGTDFLKPLDPNRLTVKDPEIYNLLVAHNRLLWLMLVTQQPIPTGKFATPMVGDRIGANDNYLLLYENKSPNPVGVRVLGTFGPVIGRQVKLSLSDKKDDSGLIEYLGNTAAGPSFNKRLSDTIVLLPKAAIYINTADIAFALTADDKFLVRVFDPTTFVTSPDWELR